GMSLAVTLMAFAGKMVMLAVKRGWTQDHGGMVGGHGAIMDRIDSLCFAAPVFFHLVRYYFT
ncbi:MAG: phosphatidate cytidylyltransferase, partial [Opitutaceae bacterium]